MYTSVYNWKRANSQFGSARNLDLRPDPEPHWSVGVNIYAPSSSQLREEARDRKEAEERATRLESAEKANRLDAEERKARGLPSVRYPFEAGPEYETRLRARLLRDIEAATH